MIQTVKAKVKLKRLDKDGNPVYKEVEKYRFRTYYTNAIGERKRKESKLFDRKKDAEKAELEFLSENKHQSSSTGIKFSDLYTMYKNDLKNNTEESTYITAVNKINKHISPFFNSMEIEKITPLTVRKWQNEMLEKKSETSSKKYSKTYLQALFVYLSTILEYGVRYYGLRTNAAKLQGNFKIKKVEENEDAENFYTIDEFKKFITYVEDDFKLFFEFLYYTGCRYGEATALTWNDFSDKSISITKSLTRKTLSRTYMLKTPKTKSSLRIIDLPEFLVKKLNEAKEYDKQKECFAEEWFIFGGIKPLAPSTVKRKADKAMKEAGLKHITLHGFRHSHASLLINGNMNIKLISSRLGHSSVTETLNTYTHMFPDQRNVCVDYLETVFEKK